MQVGLPWLLTVCKSPVTYAVANGVSGPCVCCSLVALMVCSGPANRNNHVQWGLYDGTHAGSTLTTLLHTLYVDSYPGNHSTSYPGNHSTSFDSNHCTSYPGNHKIQLLAVLLRSLLGHP